MKNLLLIFSCLILLGFTLPHTHSLATNRNTSLSDSLDIDLVSLKAKGLLNNTIPITIPNDPVYHKIKHYQAIPLLELMKKFSNFESRNISDLKVVFECEDGYKPEMPLELLVNVKAYLAVRDIDAPKGRDWEQIFKGSQEMKAAPFYVVYENVSEEDVNYKWPYNLVKIHFRPIHENDGALKPKDKDFLVGYELFKNRCQTCHSINKIGGKMGPELNYPKSVTQYWKIEDLKAFIQKPEAYRNEVKMPNLGIKKAEAEEIVKYLAYMANRQKR